MIFKFGDYELDEARFELRRRGETVTTQPKVLRLLLLLVTARERALSDEELMKLLWPQEKVGRASIKRAVMGARIALDDRTQASIRTVRGHGYQFVLPVEEVRASPAVREDARPARISAPPTAPSSFVGREGLLAELEASFGRACAGEGHGVLIFAEPGMGKTRVLSELATRARGLGARVLFGRCMEFDGAPPFWPLQQILREAMQGRSDAELRAWLGPGAADLAEVLPELKASVDGSRAPATLGPARFRFYDSTARFLTRAARDAPLLLLLDDLHCADPSTLRLVLFLVGQLASSPILLVASARPSDHRDPESRACIAELTRASATRSLELTGLTHGEVTHLLTQRTGASPPGAVVYRLLEQTAGNPLFIEAIVRGLRVHGDAPPSREVCWEHLSSVGKSLGIRGAIERHLGVLSAECRALLLAAALLGREFSVGVLRQLVELPADALLTRLSEANAAGIVHAVTSSFGHYRFNHALIRDALYEGTDALERARGHARVGGVLEARGGALGDDAELAQIAEHYRLAAPEDGGKALRYARLAAERALQRLAYEEAALHFGRALELLDLGAPDVPERMRLLLARGEALSSSAEPARARATILQAAALARELDAVDELAHAARLLGRARESGLVDHVHIELLRAALAALPDHDPRTPGLTAILAKALSFATGPAQRAELALSALALSKRLDDPCLRGEALFACHEALPSPDHADQRAYIAQELERLARLHADPRTLVHAQIARFQNCVERGDTPALDVVIRTLDGLAHSARDPVVRWYEQSFRATRFVIAGELGRAEQCAAEAYRIGKVIEEDMAYHAFCAQVTGIYRMQGRIAEAEAIVNEMVLRFPGLAGWRSVGASMQADAGRKGLARETLDALVADGLTHLRRDPFLLSALCPVAELCARVGDEQSARVLYDELLPYEGLHGNVSFGLASYGPTSLHLAQLAARMRTFDSAEAHARRALEASERMASPTFIALSALTFSGVLRRGRQREREAEARALAERAGKLAQAAGMHSLTAHARALSVAP